MEKGKVAVNKKKRNEGKTYTEIMELENAENKASEPIEPKKEGEEKKEGEKEGQKEGEKEGETTAAAVLEN